MNLPNNKCGSCNVWLSINDANGLSRSEAIAAHCSKCRIYASYNLASTLVWNVILYENNAPVKYNIFKNSNFAAGVAERIFSWSDLTREEVAQHLEHLVQWQFWGRCEYECVVSSWPPSSKDNGTKIDVDLQLQMNWDRFVEYVYNCYIILPVGSTPIRRKTEMGVCPYCGSHNTENTEFDLDIDCLWTSLVCHACNSTWTEYLSVTYDGCTYKNKTYDQDGQECTDI